MEVVSRHPVFLTRLKICEASGKLLMTSKVELPGFVGQPNQTIRSISTSSTRLTELSLAGSPHGPRILATE